MSFCKNGEDLDIAFELTDDLEGKALFPHVLVKNAECHLNFGSQVCNVTYKKLRKPLDKQNMVMCYSLLLYLCLSVTNDFPAQYRMKAPS